MLWGHILNEKNWHSFILGQGFAPVAILKSNRSTHKRGLRLTVRQACIYLSFFLNKEILLITTEAMVRNHKALEVLGRTSIKALQSSAKTQWAACA